MSYHQVRFCSVCKTKGRNVEFWGLFGQYMHYECWLRQCSINLGHLSPDPRDESDPLLDPRPNHPFKLTPTELVRQWEMFERDQEANERRQRLQARFEVHGPSAFKNGF